jgi:hypothetical protein
MVLLESIGSLFDRLSLIDRLGGHICPVAVDRFVRWPQDIFVFFPHSFAAFFDETDARTARASRLSLAFQ